MVHQTVRTHLEPTTWRRLTAWNRLPTHCRANEMSDPLRDDAPNRPDHANLRVSITTQKENVACEGKTNDDADQIKQIYKFW